MKKYTVEHGHHLKGRYYVVYHEHDDCCGGGLSVHHFRSEIPYHALPEDVELAKLLGIDFEPGEGESLEVWPVDTGICEIKEVD